MKWKFDVKCSLEDVAKELGVTKQRAWQIEKSAIEKCNKWCKRHNTEITELLEAECSTSNDFFIGL